MAALPRPDIPSGDQRVLVDALHDLHHGAGWPSLRTIARQVGVSPTTVSAVFSAPRLPAWGLLCLVVEVLHGDVEEFHGLWMAASTPEHAPTSARIAGRRLELQAARHHLESGTGLLLVTGEAGIGKTRLVSAARAGCGVFVATGAGLPLAVEVPFLPLIDALSKVLHADDKDWLPGALSTCPPYVPWTLAALLPDLPSHAGPTPPSVASARTRMFSAVGSALGALADRRPLALLLDDLHWADRDTLDLLEHLVADGLPVPLLGTF